MRALTNETIGKRVREARNKAGMTQGDLGAKLDITAQQIAKYESGQSGFTVIALLQVAKILKISHNDLLR